MKLREIIKSNKNMPGINTRIVAKPLGTGINYYDSKIHLWLDEEIADLEVDEWFVIPHKRDDCTVVIIVEHYIEYELKRRNFIKEKSK